MPRPKKTIVNEFLLLNRIKNTYIEVADKKVLVDKVTAILTGGTEPSQFVIVPNKMITFDIGLTVSLHEGDTEIKKPGRKPKKVLKLRKPRKARKPRTVRKVRKPRSDKGVKRERKPKAAVKAAPVTEVKDAPEAKPTKKPKKKRAPKQAQAPKLVEEKPAEENK